MLEAVVISPLIFGIPIMLWWGPVILYHVKITRKGTPTPTWLFLHYQISTTIVLFGLFLGGEMGFAGTLFPPLLPVFAAAVAIGKPALSYIAVLLLLGFTIGFGTSLIAAFKLSGRYQQNIIWYFGPAILIGASFAIVSTDLYLDHKMQQAAVQQGIEIIHRETLMQSLRRYTDSYRPQHAWARDTCLFYHWSYAEKRFVPTAKRSNRECE